MVKGIRIMNEVVKKVSAAMLSGMMLLNTAPGLSAEANMQVNPPKSSSKGVLGAMLSMGAFAITTAAAYAYMKTPETIHWLKVYLKAENPEEKKSAKEEFKKFFAKDYRKSVEKKENWNDFFQKLLETIKANKSINYEESQVQAEIKKLILGVYSEVTKEIKKEEQNKSEQKTTKSNTELFPKLATEDDIKGITTEMDKMKKEIDEINKNKDNVKLLETTISNLHESNDRLKKDADQQKNQRDRIIQLSSRCNFKQIQIARLIDVANKSNKDSRAELLTRRLVEQINAYPYLTFAKNRQEKITQLFGEEQFKDILDVKEKNNSKIADLQALKTELKEKFKTNIDLEDNNAEKLKFSKKLANLSVKLLDLGNDMYLSEKFELLFQQILRNNEDPVNLSDVGYSTIITLSQQDMYDYSNIILLLQQSGEKFEPAQKIPAEKIPEVEQKNLLRKVFTTALCLPFKIVFWTMSRFVFKK